MSRDDPRPERRTFLLLAAGAGAALLSGCGLNNPFDSTSTPAAEAVRDLTPDVAVAVEAVGLLRTNQANLDATRTAHPELRGRLVGFEDLYRAHLSALTEAVPDGVDTAPPAAPRTVPVSAQDALALVGQDAGSLQAGLITLAVRARSGIFARLLGSMAAGVGQQAHLLRRGPGGPR